MLEAYSNVAAADSPTATARISFLSTLDLQKDSITNIISALLSPTCIPRMSLKAEIDNHTQYARDNQKHGRTQMHHLMEGYVRKGSKKKPPQQKSLHTCRDSRFNSDPWLGQVS
jgi:hypothetical protein